MKDIIINMLGTGSPRPDIHRSGPSQTLTIDDTSILIDCGENVVRQVIKSGIELKNINYLLFTHLHADHVYGYGHFLVAGWGSGRKHLTVVGPKGTKALHEKTLDLFKEDINYRTSLGFPSEGIMDVNIIEVEESGNINIPGLPADVSAANMVHNVPTYGYRFDVGSESVVFSGDTAPTDNLVKLSKDADVLVHDACLTTTSMYSHTTRPELKQVWKNLQKEHCTPVQAAKTAKNAGVRKLVLTHFLPQINVEEISDEVSEVFKGEIIVPNDLEVIKVKQTEEVS